MKRLPRTDANERPQRRPRLTPETIANAKIISDAHLGCPLDRAFRVATEFYIQRKLRRR